nr:hypothetical protein [Tanacetum cinerariifolium]
MTKIIKEEFEKLESLKISDGSLSFNTSLKSFHEEFNWMTSMDDDLFTNEVEIRLANIPCDLKDEDDSKQPITHGSDDDMEYDPSNVKFTKWRDVMPLDYFDEDEVAKIFRIDTNVFDFETPMYRAFKEFNYLLQINPKWPTYYWKGDGYCNGGNLPGAYIVGNTLHYQDLEWYEALKDGELKEEALKNKAIMEGIIDEDDESSNEGWRRWDDYKNTNCDHKEREYEMEHEDEGICELFDDTTHKRLVSNIRRFEMIKYSFGEKEEYVAVKENEYDDLTSTSKEACRAYQELFRKMDEG